MKSPTISVPPRSGALLLSSLLCAVLAPSAFAPPTATVPVGFITKTIPVAPSASQSSLTALSVPFYQAAAFRGEVTSIESANQVTLSGAVWMLNQFGPGPAGNITTLARVKASANSASVGKFFAVAGNSTAGQLTVDLTGTGVAALSAVLAANDVVEVVPVSTIGSVFGTAASPPTLRAGVTANDADNVLIFNGSGWDTYFWTGAIGTPNHIWKRTGNVDRSTTVIYPDEGVFVVHRDPATTPSVTVMGTVPSTHEQSIILGQTFLANRFPTDTTLGGLGLHNLPGWVAGGTAGASDNVLALNASGAWDTYFWTGTAGTPNNIWKRTGNTDRSNTVIPAGTSVFITHGGANLNLVQALPYTP